MKHKPTRSLASNYAKGCRCAQCTAHHAELGKDYWDARQLRPVTEHGTRLGYWNGCRCESCRTAYREYCRKYRKRSA